MKSYKIKVATEGESKEAQELLFELGYGWKISGKKLINHSIPILYTELGVIYCGDEEIGVEITLPQLRDLAVLHRNDVGDATHEDEVGNKFYVGCEAYNWSNRNYWIKSYLVNISELTPITQEQPQMTWQDALRAVADGKEVEVDSISDGWLDVTTCCIELLQELESFRIKPQTIFLNGGNYTKEQLLKIAGEME